MLTNKIAFVMYSKHLQMELDSLVLNTTDWSFLAVTFNGLKANLYINGALASTKSLTQYWLPENVTRTGYIGKSFFSDNMYSASLVDQIALFDRALTSTEILYLYSKSYSNPLGTN